MSAELTAAYGVLVSDFRADLIRQIQEVWVGLGRYRDADIDWFVDAVSPLVRAGQVEVSDLTAAYITQLAVEAGKTVTAVELGSVTDLRGIPTEVVYRRPAIHLYTELSKGVEFPEALDRASQRLNTLVGTDLQMSKVRTSQRYTDEFNFDSWRRVVKGPHTCALCLVASTQRYWKADLAPIHPGCDCDVEPLVGHDPSDQVIDQDLLDRIHDAVDDAGFESGLSADGYQDLLFVEDHGEYGPTLTFKDHQFTNLVPAS